MASAAAVGPASSQGVASGVEAAYTAKVWARVNRRAPVEQVPLQGQQPVADGASSPGRVAAARAHGDRQRRRPPSVLVQRARLELQPADAGAAHVGQRDLDRAEAVAGRQDHAVGDPVRLGREVVHHAQEHAVARRQPGRGQQARAAALQAQRVGMDGLRRRRPLDLAAQGPQREGRQHLPGLGAVVGALAVPVREQGAGVLAAAAQDRRLARVAGDPRRHVVDHAVHHQPAALGRVVPGHFGHAQGDGRGPRGAKVPLVLARHARAGRIPP